ncbi:ATP-binding protein [Mesorhizobium sp.]|uniref:ATP-binding protein n=1 Tax=Mesorhizobium sp. TaxID=1871066 RepID=UPI003563FABC
MADLRADGFTLSLDLSDIAVVVDPVRVRQALLALVTNARRYTVRGVITISLTAYGDETVLSVADDGAGLAPDVRTRIFEPFM